MRNKSAQYSWIWARPIVKHRLRWTIFARRQIKDDQVLNEKRCGVNAGGIDVIIFEEYLSGITDMEQLARMAEILKWVSDQFPDLEPRYAWNQPMFTDHGTFIIVLLFGGNDILYGKRHCYCRFTIQCLLSHNQYFEKP